MGDVIKDILMAKIFGGGGTPSGGGDTEESGTTGIAEKDVNFYDYDGTCVYAYTVAEAQALTELPAGPTHDGLTFQGWNWSLENVKALTRPMSIGAMYITDDGTTRLYITLQEGRTSPMLGVGVNGTVTVDWGDGTEPDVLTGTSVRATQWTPNHAYVKPGDYVIRLTVDGEMAFQGNSSTSGGACILSYSNGLDKRSYAYWKALRRVEIGDNVACIDNYAFRRCYKLESISFPSGFIGIGMEYPFQNCHGLSALVIPCGVTGVDNYTFRDQYVISQIILPEGVTSFGSSSFRGCNSLTTFSIPPGISNIGEYTFQDCYSVACYDFTSHTAVPTLAAASAFGGIPDDCEIRVPAALYDEWIAATNWATYADYIKAY